MFLSVELLLRLAVPGLPMALTMLGSIMLLSAFFILILAGLLGVAKITLDAISDYFSAKQQAQRRLWFVQGRYNQIQQLFYFKKVQLKYSDELHRKRLLISNNRKHTRALSKTIQQDLRLIKAKLSATAYQQLQQDYVCYRNQQNIDGLLTLQQKIASLVG